MAVVSNKNTTQQPLSAVGRNGTQTVKFIPACRIYIKTADALTNTPAYGAISNGVTPTGWTDLGITTGAKVSYIKQLTEMTSAIDGYSRNIYTKSKAATIEFMLSQFDDVVLETISGLTPSVINSSIVSYQLGQESLSKLAMLMVCQNKFDGKEIQFYNPSVFLNLSTNYGTDQLSMKVVGSLPFFMPKGATKQACLTTTLFNLGAAAVVLTSSGYNTGGYGAGPYDAPPVSSSGYGVANYGVQGYGL